MGDRGESPTHLRLGTGGREQQVESAKESETAMEKGKRRKEIQANNRYQEWECTTAGDRLLNQPQTTGINQTRDNRLKNIGHPKMKSRSNKTLHDANRLVKSMAHPKSESTD